MPGPVHLLKKRPSPDIGDFALCGKGRLGLITSLSLGTGAYRKKIVAKGVVLLPVQYAGQPWLSGSPAIYEHLDGETIERLTREK